MKINNFSRHIICRSFLIFLVHTQVQQAVYSFFLSQLRNKHYARTLHMQRTQITLRLRTTIFGLHKVLCHMDLNPQYPIRKRRGDRLKYYVTRAVYLEVMFNYSLRRRFITPYPNRPYLKFPIHLNINIKQVDCPTLSRTNPTDISNVSLRKVN